MLNGDALGSAIAAKIDQLEKTQEILNDKEKLWKAFGQAFVEYFTTNARVNPGITVATSGSATAQTGATNGPGTIS